MTHENKRIFITSYEDNTIFAEKVLQEEVWDGEELVVPSCSESLHHTFENNELQALLTEKTVLDEDDLLTLLATQKEPFGLSELKF